MLKITGVQWCVVEFSCELFQILNSAGVFLFQGSTFAPLLRSAAPLPGERGIFNANGAAGGAFTQAGRSQPVQSGNGFSEVKSKTLIFKSVIKVSCELTE